MRLMKEVTVIEERKDEEVCRERGERGKCEQKERVKKCASIWHDRGEERESMQES